MNPAQLQTFLDQHRTAVLGVAAAGVAGLALVHRRKAAATGQTTGGAVAPAGTIPAAAVVPASGSIGGAYDSSAYDVYNALQGPLEQILQTGSRGSGLNLPAPVASTLFAPSYTGNYATTSAGDNVEIESDGSLFHLTTEAMQRIGQNSPGAVFTKLAAAPGWYSTTGNLQAKAAGNAPALGKFDANGNLTAAT